MKNTEIRKLFLDFFQENRHKYAKPSPLVNKTDPTLMSGKHNDLDEVGIDTYHHTLFEMLGNWSMNDYFKEEAIFLAWKLLTEVYKIDKDRLYVTVFEGDKNDNLQKDEEAYKIWSKFVSPERIILGNKHDNFWEMGETGPCGPCTEIHIDVRNDEEREKINGKSLVNTGHPEVIEIWNIVFIQYERLADRSLKKLEKHFIDTGMGFERLVRVLQNKKSNYDTDIFTPYISAIENLSGLKYKTSKKIDIAMRVIADHIRAITMTIAEGLIPSNIQEGYVIRRILRRAVRYGYSFLNFQEPFLYKLTKIVFEQFEFFKNNIVLNISEVEKIIFKEEESFFKTLKSGMKRLNDIIDISKSQKNYNISGYKVFELYDTYGFPSDLTNMILSENKISFNKEEFQKALEEQKNRSRNCANIIKDDWIIVNEGKNEFIGYDYLESTSKILKYREIYENDKKYYQIVFAKTPFYGESGGQVGDTGFIITECEDIEVFDTKKEFEDILHCVKTLPKNLNSEVLLRINIERRNKISANHSCTHILQAALRKLFDENIKQCGSHVDENKLRFDFNYSNKLSEEDIKNLEEFVNEKLHENLKLIEKRDVDIESAKNENVTALFGNKYGEKVRVIEFDSFSKELCCGTHVKNSGIIKNFKILKCKNISSGIKRIEASSEL